MSPILTRAAWTRPYAWPFLALFAFNILLFLVFTLPRSIKERHTAAEALALRKEMEGRRAEIAQVRTRAETVKANISETATFYSESVPTCAGEPALVLKDLTAAARELGVVVDHISTVPKDLEKLPLAEIAVTMPIAGTYANVGAFLQKLERSDHFLVVDSIGLRERIGDGGGAEVSIKLNAYCHSPEAGKSRGRR